MRVEFEKALKYGEIILENNFETSKGTYKMLYARRNDKIYMFKYRDDKLLECKNLSTMKAREQFSLDTEGYAKVLNDIYIEVQKDIAESNHSIYMKGVKINHD